MALSKDALKKLKGKMKGPPAKDPNEGKDAKDPMFEIPDDESQEDGGDVDNRSRNASPDAGASKRTVARAEDGDIASSGEGDEGTPDHEEMEGKHEKAAEHDKLADVSDDDLLHELKRRGHPAGEHLGKSKGVDEEPDEAEASDYHEEADTETEQ